jgi:hypothetical protein
MKKKNNNIVSLFDQIPVNTCSPIFEHDYYKPSIFLGSWEGHDLYYANVNGVDYLLDRYDDGNFYFHGEKASLITEDKESYLGNALIMAKKAGLIKQKINENTKKK